MRSLPTCVPPFANGRAPRALRKTRWMRSARAVISTASLPSAARKTCRPFRATPNPMPRYAFKLRIKADAIEEYEREHQRVWPELLAKLKAVGISEYSIFRRGQDLVL